VTCPLPTPKTVSDATQLRDYMIADDEVISQPLPLMSMHFRQYYVPSFEPFTLPLSADSIQNFQSMPLVSFEDMDAIKLDASTEPKSTISYFCFISDPLNRYESAVNHDLSTISSNYVSVLDLLSQMSKMVSNVTQDKSVKYTQIPIKAKANFDTSLESVARSQLAGLESLSLTDMVDMSSTSEMASVSGSLLTLTQYAHNDLLANGFMQIADCSLVSQSNAQILCLGHNEILIEAAVITVRTTMFYSAHHEAYGMLIYREYHQITGDKECSVIADGMTLYLNPSCCTNLKAANGDWGLPLYTTGECTPLTGVS
jgi:hypothetical protein